MSRVAPGRACPRMGCRLVTAGLLPIDFCGFVVLAAIDMYACVCLVVGNLYFVLAGVTVSAFVVAGVGSRCALPAMERRDLVAWLSGQGMSTRAIAPIVGVSKDTVHRDIAGVSNETPAPVES